MGKLWISLVGKALLQMWLRLWRMVVVIICYYYYYLVSGDKTTSGLAMPIFIRSLFLSDLHNMCLYFEKEGGFKADINVFKSIVPTAMTAEDWFRYIGKYSNGKSFINK